MSTLVREREARLEPGDLSPLCMGQDDPRPRSPARLRLRSQEGSILPSGSVEPPARSPSLLPGPSQAHLCQDPPHPTYTCDSPGALSGALLKLQTQGRESDSVARAQGEGRRPGRAGVRLMPAADSKQKRGHPWVYPHLTPWRTRRSSLLTDGPGCGRRAQRATEHGWRKRKDKSRARTRRPPAAPRVLETKRGLPSPGHAGGGTAAGRGNDLKFSGVVLSGSSAPVLLILCFSRMRSCIAKEI